MAFKKDNPFMKKMEEKKGKDLDGDGEKGEAPAHKAKVLGSKKKAAPFGVAKAPGSKGNGKGMCAACKKAGNSSCSHM